MLKLRIVSPEKVVYNSEVESLKVPGMVGEFEILDNHAPIISTLVNGTVVYTTKDGSQSLPVKGGFVEVKKNEVSLCVEV